MLVIIGVIIYMRNVKKNREVRRIENFRMETEELLRRKEETIYQINDIIDYDLRSYYEESGEDI